MGKANDFLLFKDNCEVGKSGKGVRWTNYLPILFIVFQCSWLFTTIINSLKEKEKFNSINNNKYIISVLFSLIVIGLNIYIMFNMTYLCNSFFGLLIFIVLTYLSSQIYTLLFPNITKIWNDIYKHRVEYIAQNSMNAMDIKQTDSDSCNCYN